MGSIGFPPASLSWEMAGQQRGRDSSQAWRGAVFFVERRGKEGEGKRERAMTYSQDTDRVDGELVGVGETHDCKLSNRYSRKDGFYGIREKKKGVCRREKRNCESGSRGKDECSRWGVSFMYHVAVSQKELIQVG